MSISDQFLTRAIYYVVCYNFSTRKCPYEAEGEAAVSATHRISVIRIVCGREGYSEAVVPSTTREEEIEIPCHLCSGSVVARVRPERRARLRGVVLLLLPWLILVGFAALSWIFVTIDEESLPAFVNNPVFVILWLILAPFVILGPILVPMALPVFPILKSGRLPAAVEYIRTKDHRGFHSIGSKYWFRRHRYTYEIPEIYEDRSLRLNIGCFKSEIQDRSYFGNITQYETKVARIHESVSIPIVGLKAARVEVIACPVCGKSLVKS